MSVVHFGIDGEETYYDVAISILVSGETSGAMLLELFPKRICR